jgi:hypothetical protein
MRGTFAAHDHTWQSQNPIGCGHCVHKGLHLSFEGHDDYLKFRPLNAQHTVLMGIELGYQKPKTDTIQRLSKCPGMGSSLGFFHFRFMLPRDENWIKFALKNLCLTSL